MSLSTSHSKSILYSAFSTFSLFHSKIGFLHSHKTKFKPDANLFYFPTTQSSSIYAIIPCPYLSTPTPLFNLQKSSPKIFTFFGISTALFNSIIYCHLLSIDFLTVYLLARSIRFKKNIFYETTIMIVLNSYNQTNVLLG